MVITRNRLTQLVQENAIKNKSQKVKIDTTSICLHLDNQFTYYEPYDGEPFVPPKTMPTTTRSISLDDHIILPPGGKVLACSQEEVQMPHDLMGFVQTKGSIARGFLFAHICDGQIDPGYTGKITLELLNTSDFYYKLIPGMAIASLFFLQADEEINDYDGRYQNSMSPTAMVDHSS
ncbi:dCTP deaminase [Neptuniibacter sp. 2_MG-2023]|jgi:dCTP deaminase|uniref:dCTP deaminase n=1 Tax=Neptuniibacter sp. 2_MG-2023 TaxID=3062671 RepID=UPI0026E194EC|nr:dCTP deaminase [Neptuniibacter sp. 2_MG-2023]MDO6514478.1 dCTP deaminase [Neptuniibacter sp. 2_MG-2023]